MVQWRVSDGLTPYPEAVAFMQDRVAQIAAGEADEMIWLLEHPPLYTAGTSAKSGDLVDPNRLPVFQTGRGGQYTYHGPGQRVAYVMLNVGNRGHDVRKFVHQLETWVIATLAEFNITGDIRRGRVGVWVDRHAGTEQAREDKVAAIGIRLKKWISFHGLSINVDPELENYAGIIPCGITEHGVTSLNDLGILVKMADVDLALQRCFEDIFGATNLFQKCPPKGVTQI